MPLYSDMIPESFYDNPGKRSTYQEFADKYRFPVDQLLNISESEFKNWASNGFAVNQAGTDNAQIYLDYVKPEGTYANAQQLYEARPEFDPNRHNGSGNNLFEDIGDSFDEQLSNAGTAITTPFVDAGDSIGDNITDAGDSIGDNITDAGDSLNQIGKSDGDAATEMFGKLWPYKQDQLDTVSDLFNSGDTLNPAFSDDTQEFMDSTRGRALDGSGTINNAETQLNSLFGSVDPSSGLYNDLSTGEFGQNTASGDRLGSIANRAGGNSGLSLLNSNLDSIVGNKAFGQLGKTSSGAYLENNPYLDNLFDAGSEKLTNAFDDSINKINSSFNLAGGFGSSARGDALTDRAGTLTNSIGDLYNNIYAGNYQQERNRQESATSALGGFSDSATNRFLNAADTNINQFNTDTNLLSNVDASLNNVFSNNVNRQVSGASGQSDIFNQNFSNTLNAVNPSLQFGANDYMDIGQLGAVGNMQDIQNQKLAMEPWQQAGLFGDAIGGLPGAAPSQGGNPIMGALGGAAAGSAFGPWGAVGGGVLGYLGSK